MRMAFLLEMLLLTCAQVIANSYQSLDHSIPVELYVFVLQIKFNNYVFVQDDLLSEAYCKLVKPEGKHSHSVIPPTPV